MDCDDCRDLCIPDQYQRIMRFNAAMIRSDLQSAATGSRYLTRRTRISYYLFIGYMHAERKSQEWRLGGRSVHFL